MAQNVKVCCRFRPANRQERAENSTSCITCDDTSVNIVMPETNSQEKHSFNFDRVFDTDSTQISVFEKTAQPLVKDVFEGYNTTIFAYGQTGSGKTFTMMGDSKEDRLKGIIPRLAEAIFNGIEEAEVGTEFTVKLSYVEIYNEKIRDLLNPRLADNLKIREGSQGVWIQDVTETYVGSFDQVLEIMQQGSMNRAQASTNMNLESSRSHSVFILTLGQLNQQTGTKKGAKLTLVDLAGSEKVRKTGAAGAVLEEAKHINKSLSALGNVINALTSNAAHIPYRDSKLTRLLSDSLGGNCRTCLIITCSPMSTNAEETLSTLRFGIRAKTIKNMAKVNQEQSVSEYKRLLALAEKKIGAQGAIILALEHDLATLADYLASCDQNILPKPIPVLSGRGGVSAASATTTSSATITSADTDISISSHSDDDTPETKSSESSSPSTLPMLTPTPTHARTSSTDHISASALALANIDLEGRVQELDRTNQFLRVQLQDKEKELEEQLESITSDKSKMEQELDGERRRREEAELKAQHMKDTMQEYAMLKKKMELMEKEHTLSIMQLKEESYQLKMKLADLQTNTAAGAGAGAAAADKDKDATTSTSSSRKSLMQRLTGTPGATDRQPSPSPSRSPPSTPGQTSPPSRADATSPVTSAAVAAAVASSSPASSSVPSAGQQNKVDTLIAALQRKCDQYIQLQMAHQNQAEHLAMVEFALEEATQKMRDAQEEPQKKIRALEEKLLAAENLCTRLLESGRYWQKERNKQTRAQQKIVVPLQGGGKKPGTNTNTNTTTNTTTVMKTSNSMDVFF